MNTKIFAFIIIFMIIAVIPTSNAQLSLGAQANQKLIELKINSLGEVNVKHVISPTNMPVNVDLFTGTISNISIINEKGEDKEFGIIGDNNAVMIFPSKQNSIIKYNLDDVLILNDNLWSFKISYNQLVSIIFPKETELIFVDNTPIQLGDKKGIACHGCNINLQYYSTIPKIIQEIEWEEKLFNVEIITNAEIEKFNFNQSLKSITFQVNDENKFITTTIPLELLWGPYVVLLNDEKIKYNKYMDNETHVLLNIKPETSGEISIVGTTVIPEFPIIAPLAIGFLMILAMPLMKKINLH